MFSFRLSLRDRRGRGLLHRRSSLYTVPQNLARSHPIAESSRLCFPSGVEGGVRLGVRGVVLVMCVCVGVGGVALCRCVCVFDLLFFSQTIST